MWRVLGSAFGQLEGLDAICLRPVATTLLCDRGDRADRCNWNLFALKISKSCLEESAYTAFVFISFPFHGGFLMVEIAFRVAPTLQVPWCSFFPARGTGEEPSKKSVVSAEKDFTDGTVAFQSKSKCILVAVVELQWGLTWLDLAWLYGNVGLSENRLNPYTQWFCWSLSLWKMAISLGVYPIFRQTHVLNLILSSAMAQCYWFSLVQSGQL